MLDWLPQRTMVVVPEERLTLSEAAKLFGRAKGAIYRDCRHLGIDTSVPKGGCLTRDDCWIIYVFLCWKLHCQNTRAWWRGDRRDYEKDCQTTEQKLAYVALAKGSKVDFNRRFDNALDDKRLSINPTQELCYG